MQRTIVLCAIITLTVISFTQAQDDKASGKAATDPCADLECKEPGQECVVNNDKAECQCMQECPSEWNDYPRSICTTEDITFRHECDMWRTQCLCKSNKCPETKGKRPSSFIIKYFDECRDLKSMCDWQREKSTFPLRMSLWLRDLFNLKWSIPAGGDAIDDTMLRPMTPKTRDSVGKLFNTNAGNSSAVPTGIITYWFCELDRDRSNSLSSEELVRLTQVLSPSTPCLDEFIDSCGSGSVTNANWHKCFEADNSGDKSDCSLFY